MQSSSGKPTTVPRAASRDRGCDSPTPRAGRNADAARAIPSPSTHRAHRSCRAGSGRTTTSHSVGVILFWRARDINRASNSMVRPAVATMRDMESPVMSSSPGEAEQQLPRERAVSNVRIIINGTIPCQHLMSIYIKNANKT